MDETWVAIKIFESKPEDRRQLGRPRLRWLEAVENDSRYLKVNRWRRKASNREDWTFDVNKANFLRGP
jgi:hypothetical protein